MLIILSILVKCVNEGITPLVLNTFNSISSDFSKVIIDPSLPICNQDLIRMYYSSATYIRFLQASYDLNAQYLYGSVGAMSASVVALTLFRNIIHYIIQ